ncbi:MAG: MmgE/PrpD family protein [Proteobacteria bacterium]|nr:MmgE/PrpD family protein [Pseudomonadota bacterium]
MTLTASQTLARFAAALDYASIPEAALVSARQCIADTVAVATFGARLPWTRITQDYARRYGDGGRCSVLGAPALRVTAPLAALANGAAAHAFELDSLRFPGSGVHPGATLLPAALAIAEESGADGRALVTAFVAGCEVMFRIGLASHHSSETLGFHAPGLTGAFGSTVVAGKLLGLDADALANALGLAGSLGAGVLAFTKSTRGGMVKRLHMGRAAEAGVVAARLAQGRYEGPETILDGRYGYLDVFCEESDAAEFGKELGTRWETQTICLKRYACHITAHTSVQALSALRAQEGFAGDAIAEITIEAGKKMLSHHANAAPADIMQGQYSIPFCVALAAYRDALAPASFDDEAVADTAIRALASRVKLVPATAPLPSSWATRIAVRLHDGRTFACDAYTFKGMPGEPLTAADLEAKFVRTLASAGVDDAAAVASFARWMAVDRAPDVATLVHG